MKFQDKSWYNLTMTQWIPTIGLEIHAEIKTQTKMFCSCRVDPDETHPNINICPICLGHPGTLPTINKKAIRDVIKVGLSLGGKISKLSKFYRKNYFYPDLPKGYQISQYDEPLVIGGKLKINDKKEIKIRRIHIEEDTGKNIHPEGKNYSLVDFNRAGVPLMELVTEPDINSPEEAYIFAKELQMLLRYLGVSDADMEKGQMRLEANVSVRKQGEELGTKVELKNLNSFKTLQDAISYEIERQIFTLERGEKIKQETRGWDETKRKTFSQRWKEEAQDYRYFPEPDLPPVEISDAEIQSIQSEIPELPWQKRSRLVKEYNLSEKEAEIFVEDPEFADFLEKVVSELYEFDKDPQHPLDRKNIVRLAVNYILSDLRGLMTQSNSSIYDILISPENFAHLIFLLHRNEISSRGAKDALKKMFETGMDPEIIIQEMNLIQLSDTNELEKIIKNVIEENKKAVQDFKNGKKEALQFLVGQTMAKSKGRANPKLAEDILKNLLG
jgi:aspartyl-tRNA(Asn)/glutamyl-tRNA(Gln) amidotransferase subunit B